VAHCWRLHLGFQTISRVSSCGLPDTAVSRRAEPWGWLPASWLIVWLINSKWSRGKNRDVPNRAFVTSEPARWCLNFEPCRRCGQTLCHQKGDGQQGPLQLLVPNRKKVVNLCLRTFLLLKLFVVIFQASNLTSYNLSRLLILGCQSRETSRFQRIFCAEMRTMISSASREQT